MLPSNRGSVRTSLRSDACIFAARPQPGAPICRSSRARRDGDQVRQQVIATLGRYEELQASGQLERLLRSGARFSAKAMVLSAAQEEATLKIASRRIGPALLFERLWEETGCRKVHRGAGRCAQARHC